MPRLPPICCTCELHIPCEYLRSQDPESGLAPNLTPPGTPCRSPPSLPSPQAAAPAPAPLDLSEMAERLSELCAKAAAVPQHFEYAEPSPAPAQRFAGAWAPQPYSRIELAERLAELAAKEGTRLAVASLADSLDYAQPGLGRAQRKVRAAGGSMCLREARFDGAGRWLVHFAVCCCSRRQLLGRPEGNGTKKYLPLLPSILTAHHACLASCPTIGPAGICRRPFPPRAV